MNFRQIYSLDKYILFLQRYISTNIILKDIDTLIQIYISTSYISDIRYCPFFSLYNIMDICIYGLYLELDDYPIILESSYYVYTLCYIRIFKNHWKEKQKHKHRRKIDSNFPGYGFELAPILYNICWDSYRSLLLLVVFPSLLLLLVLLLLLFVNILLSICWTGCVIVVLHYQWVLIEHLNRI